MHSTYVSGQKVLDVEKAKQPPLEKEMHLICANGQKVFDAEEIKQSFRTYKRSQKIDDTYSCAIDLMKTCTGRTIKLSVKVRDAKSTLDQKSTPVEQSLKIEDFVIQLTYLLEA